MATLTVVFTDNGDGTVTVTSTAGAPAQTLTTTSSTHATDVAQGWLDNAIPSLQ